ncbi:MAG: hypothetical protein EBX41_02650 [Chitinophagia bacterium]|nr:hypothetical protein [Chitinophagia bacterium]
MGRLLVLLLMLLLLCPPSWGRRSHSRHRHGHSRGHKRRVYVEPTASMLNVGKLHSYMKDDTVANPIFRVQPDSGRHKIVKKVVKPDSMVVWTAGMQYSWDMYRGIPPKKTYLPFNSVFVLVCGKGGNDRQVMAQFNTSKSWLNKGIKMPDYQLIHEKVKFNIVELCARKMRKEINESAVKGTALPPPSELLAKWNAELAAMHKQYELETANGSNTAAQQQWNMKISLMLSELSNYL